MRQCCSGDRLAHSGYDDPTDDEPVLFKLNWMAFVLIELFLLRCSGNHNDILNRLKRRDLRILLICLGAVVGRPFDALVIAGALAHACVIGILIKGWARSGKTDGRKTA